MHRAQRCACHHSSGLSSDGTTPARRMRAQLLLHRYTAAAMRGGERPAPSHCIYHVSGARLTAQPAQTSQQHSACTEALSLRAQQASSPPPNADSDSKRPTTAHILPHLLPPNTTTQCAAHFPYHACPFLPPAPLSDDWHATPSFRPSAVPHYLSSPSRLCVRGWRAGSACEGRC